MDGFTPAGKAEQSVSDADAVLALYERLTGSAALLEEVDEGEEYNDSEALTDLLTDLRHWAAANQIDFLKHVDLSEMHFDGETE